MRRGDKRVKTINGEKLEMEYLGQGKFCTAWHKGDDVYLFVKEDPDRGDYSKECLSTGWASGKHVPAMEQIGQAGDGPGYYDNGIPMGDLAIYRTKYHESPLMVKHGQAWRVYKTLRDAREAAWVECSAKYLKRYGHAAYGTCWRNGMGYDLMVGTLKLAKGEVPESIYDSLESMSNAWLNYGSSGTWEFAPRNLGVDDKGNLMFIDILFDPTKL
jgi:hypothetical protein